MAVPIRSTHDIDSALGWKHDAVPEALPTGIGELDGVIEGCPRGRITEVIGPVSSGRTTLAHAVLAEATRVGEVCAVVDTSNAFDPESAAAAGVRLEQVLMVRCGGDAGHALRAADLLLHGGGFGVVMLDLCEVADAALRRIPISYWYRFRRAIESTPTVFLLVGREPSAKACSSLIVEMKRDRAHFRGTFPFEYLEGARYEARSRKPVMARGAGFEARLLGGA